MEFRTILTLLWICGHFFSSSATTCYSFYASVKLLIIILCELAAHISGTAKNTIELSTQKPTKTKKLKTSQERQNFPNSKSCRFVKSLNLQPSLSEASTK